MDNIKGWRIQQIYILKNRRLLVQTLREKTPVLRKKAIRFGWRMVSELKLLFHHAFYRFHTGLFWTIKFSFRLIRKYYATIVPMLLISGLKFFPKQMEEFIASFHLFGMAFFFLLFVVRCFSLVGFSFLGITASLLYGFYEGFCLFFFGSMIGMFFQYYSVRKKWIKIPGEGILRKAPSPRTVLGITLVRACPIFPFDLVTIRLAYDRNTTFWQFLQGTVLGSFPWFVALSLGVHEEKAEILMNLLQVLVITIISFILILLFIAALSIKTKN